MQRCPPPLLPTHHHTDSHVVGGQMEGKKKEKSGGLAQTSHAFHFSPGGRAAFDIPPHNNCAVSQFTPGMSV